MKIFIEEGKLIVNDESTINEFYNFIKSEKISEKYAAEAGYKDDMVLSLAIALAPFKHIKAFDDLEIFLRAVHAEHDTEDNPKTEDYYSLIAESIGFSDESIDEPKSILELTDDLNSADETESWSAVRNLNRGGY